jgi:hypothetical protein
MHAGLKAFSMHSERPPILNRASIRVGKFSKLHAAGAVAGRGDCEKLACRICAKLNSADRRTGALIKEKLPAPHVPDFDTL